MREQMHVRIVPMTGDHLDEVAELERICFTTPWSRNMLVEELQNDCAAFLVALDDEDHVAGYAGLLVVLDEALAAASSDAAGVALPADSSSIDWPAARFFSAAMLAAAWATAPVATLAVSALPWNAAFMAACFWAARCATSA